MYLLMLIGAHLSCFAFLRACSVCSCLLVFVLFARACSCAFQSLFFVCTVFHDRFSSSFLVRVLCIFAFVCVRSCLLVFPSVCSFVNILVERGGSCVFVFAVAYSHILAFWCARPCFAVMFLDRVC